MNPEEDRLVELETKVAYQEDSVRSLSDTLARQQGQIDQLERLCRQILDRLKTQTDESSPRNRPEDDVPPHY